LDLEDVDGRTTSASRSTPSTVHLVDVGSVANALEAMIVVATQKMSDLIILKDG
jgi:hypothetical protein